MTSDADWIAQAVALSATALERPGTEPFGALVVRDGQVVGRGLNHSLARLDPTSHGETEAIRDACRRLGTLDLSDCAIYSSCEPCPLCLAAIEIAGIRRVGWALGLAEANAALAAVPPSVRRAGEVAELRRVAAAPAAARPGAVQAEVEGALAILARWAAARAGR
ncbi:nucleoside deaminase [Albimonas pacifica]|uniref:Cytidine and deoxycytidylate deaminase zinc-binding region n=1 Tax=Albimonas pacifica TaxID=1114924 RepID=A0A1I3DCZ8_9RHOB|nr:nucleoside deaminase [Albimonas pacifica]SFH84587.1 Cytidine and deoxycytidylate deaminase zinc-binding region [Albimonas pacifica]